MIAMSAMSYGDSVGFTGTAPRPRKVVGVLNVDRTLTAKGLIWLVASATQACDHPLMQEVVTYAYELGMRLAIPCSRQAVSDSGLRAVVDGREVLADTRHEALQVGLDDGPIATQVQLLHAAGLVVLYITIDGVLAGGIVFGECEHNDADVTPICSSGGLR
jgi:cation transport ATPase